MQAPTNDPLYYHESYPVAENEGSDNDPIHMCMSTNRKQTPAENDPKFSPGLVSFVPAVDPHPCSHTRWVGSTSPRLACQKIEAS